MKALGNRELGIPEHIDIYHLDREIDATDMSALEAVSFFSWGGGGTIYTSTNVFDLLNIYV